MNTPALAFALAGLWGLQILLSWFQARRFLRAVAELRALGTVATGLHRRRGLRTYVAVATADGHVTGARTLRGLTVFSRPAPCDALLGVPLTDVAAERLEGLHPRVRAAAAHAASTLLRRPRRAPATTTA